ncbi:MAG: hypothetical protein M1816_001418 [Peltula sp. TS41687]|nr:MAG: hypothetical protein M1816_001418 [Peltula sp. TS41687]
MYGPDVFAVLIPCDDQNRARTAFGLRQNERRFIKATAPSPGPDSSPLSPSEITEDDDATCDRIILRFSDPLNNPLEGVQFGTHVLADVFLGSRGTMGISARQCNIAVDDNLWVWLHDYHSTHGTAVGYDDDQKDEVRKCDTWILSYAPGTPKRLGKITVHVSGLAFKIDFPNHQTASPEYIVNLRKFHQQCKNAAPPIDAVDLNSSNPSTAAPSQAQTPGKRAIYLDAGLIGKGTFGEVWRVIKTRNGQYYAMKKWFPPDSPITKKRDKKRKRDDPAWQAWLQQIRYEYELMKSNPHVSDTIEVFVFGPSDDWIDQPNVMPVHDFQDTVDGPVLVMPYYESGNLEDLGFISEDLCVRVLLDLLLGLSHLHGRGIIHHDLKPANLLVKEPFKIIIADFGLSKFAEDKLFSTFCGTAEYLAPEVFPGVQTSYGPKADVWSAAILLMRLYKRRELQRWSQEWSNILLKTLHNADENDDQVIEILRYMLEPDPEKRYSADECLARGCSNGLFRRSDNDHVVVATEASPEDNGAQTPTLPPERMSAYLPAPLIPRDQSGEDTLVRARNHVGQEESDAVVLPQVMAQFAHTSSQPVAKLTI